MKRVFPFYGTAFFLISLLILLQNYSGTVHAQESPTPTPTYNPLAEPFLPENPSDYDLGRNWYWHNCMTCHGDVGQGLTDEFRAIWPEDHQNCWEHGCHGGRRDDEGFPLPTIVPALDDEEKLAQFPSQQAFFEFLKASHPPQDPGGLEDEQYQAIVKFVFSMNDRPPEASTPAPAITPTFTNTPVPEAASETETQSQANIVLYVGLGIILVAVGIWGLRNRPPSS